jgi:hypothetical protein
MENKLGLEGGSLHNVRLHEGEPSVALQIRYVVRPAGNQAIETGDLVSAGKQFAAEVVAYEPRSPCYQYSHQTFPASDLCADRRDLLLTDMLHLGHTA